MSERIEKIGMLWSFLSKAFTEWRDEVWRSDLDAHYCCDGRECGCGGITVRGAYK